MEQYMSRQVKDMPKNNQYAIVTFGANAVVEQFLTSEKHSFQILSAPEADATNLEEAVSTGLSMIPDNAAGRLVVLTDGKQTKGNIEHTASALTAKNVQLYSVLYEDTKQGSDAYIENVEMPEYLYPGDSYSMTVTVESNYETDAKLQLLQGTEMVSQTGVHLNKGSNRFVLKQKVVGTDAQQYTVRVKAPKDTCEKTMIMVRMRRWIPCQRFCLYLEWERTAHRFRTFGCCRMQLPAGIRSQCTGYFKRDAAVQEHHSGKCVPDRSAGGLSKKSENLCERLRMRSGGMRRRGQFCTGRISGYGTGETSSGRYAAAWGE